MSLPPSTPATFFPPVNADDQLDNSLNGGDDSRSTTPDDIEKKRSQFSGAGRTAPNGMRLDVKRFKEVWNETKNDYVTEPDKDDELLDGDKTDEDYAFTIVRSYKRTAQPNIFSITTYIHVRSPYFVEAAKEVMKTQCNVAWNANPLKFPVEQVLAFLPQFEEYLATLKKSDDNVHPDMIIHLDYAIDFLKLEYNTRLSELNSLLKEKRITFDLLWGVFVPGSILIANCGLTQEPIAVRLRYTYTADKTDTHPRRFVLSCEHVDFGEGRIPGFGDHEVELNEFFGAKPITDLDAFPMNPYLEPEHEKTVRSELIARGRKCFELSVAPRHMHYSGIAFRRVRNDPCEYKKISVKSRIVIDREMFDIHCSLYSSPSTPRDLDGQLTRRSRMLCGKDSAERDLTDDELLITPTRLFGFSLADRKWLEFNVDLVEPIVWKPEPFEQLDLPGEKKDVVKALVESHTQELNAFDDFVEGKGAGLVLNLHGPPGVGKTLTAEATSEIARSPLYMVGGGDLGTNANALDDSLSSIFTLATAWKAVVLIDEADVFLERRAKDDLKRNAMVSVFLRQLEYYPGILILTTNRVDVFDEAIQSRIHVSLHYNDLTMDTRGRLWRAFLVKAGMEECEVAALDSQFMDQLVSRKLNGREIKNIVKTASTFASHKGRTISIEDILCVTEMDKSSVLQSVTQREKTHENQNVDVANVALWLHSPGPLIALCTVSILISAAAFAQRLSR